MAVSSIRAWKLTARCPDPLSVLFLLPALFGVVNAGPTGGINVSLVRSLNARSVAPVLDFSNSTWIWTGEETIQDDVVPAVVRPFRNSIPSSSTKCPVCATIIISCDNTYSLFVNGREIGSENCISPNLPNIPVHSFVFTVGLEPEGHNVFAISVWNEIDPAGLIATILVDYSDGTTETLVTDDTWKTMKAVPPGGWTSPSYNDSAWTPAVSDGPTENTRMRAFRAGMLTILATGPSEKPSLYPMGKLLSAAREDSYTLYVNGKNIGSGSGRTKMQAYSIPNLDPNMNVITVDGASTRSDDRVYLAASMLVAYNDGTLEVYSTDGSWRTLNGLPPAGFEQPDADNSDWYGASIRPDCVVGTDVTVPDA
ncbi:hypothetical protein IW262DRAFT_1296853 [Armillaria fumosa]|nr:hypothetical protein IW262DRAFT_1296853 [Armillaria fumosa]